ncbi:MAG: Hpt domain-containing protein, partial [Gammaproteobacteria bacterium]|nr:Hpt domain-containing protein [Gammaproteobacteria bacterium]
IETIKALIDALGKDDFKEIYEEFNTRTPILLQELFEAAVENDQAAMMRLAHALKGSGSNIGAADFSAACNELEKEILAGTLTHPSRYVANIESFYQLSKSQLMQIL